MRYADYAMGTIVSFDVRAGHCSHTQACRALRRATARLHRADEIFSTWKPDSPMSRLRRDEITLAQAPPEVAEILWVCADARRLSGGRFDPWAAPGGVDPSGLVGGWAVADALEILRSAGVAAAMVDAGGVVGAFGSPASGRPWRIPVPTPGRAGRSVGMVEGAGAAATVAADAISTLGSAVGVLRYRSATVTGPRLAVAQALAVAMLAPGAGGPALVDGIPGFSAMTVDVEGVVDMTPGFPGRVFSQPIRAGAAA